MNLRSFGAHSINITGVVFLLCMVSAVFIGIVFRYVVQRPIMWIEEFARFMFIWNIYIGTIIAFRQKSHPKIDYFVGLLPQQAQNIVNAATRILIAITSFMLIWQGTLFAYKFRFMKSIAMGAPWWIMYVAIPFTFGVIFMTDCVEFYALIRRKHQTP
jgi:TRAP-type C4-dicarboxylate transport system permease small subunit